MSLRYRNSLTSSTVTPVSFDEVKQIVDNFRLKYYGRRPTRYEMSIRTYMDLLARPELAEATNNNYYLSSFYGIEVVIDEDIKYGSIKTVYESI